MLKQDLLPPGLPNLWTDTKFFKFLKKNLSFFKFSLWHDIVINRSNVVNVSQSDLHEPAKVKSHVIIS